MQYDYKSNKASLLTFSEEFYKEWVHYMKGSFMAVVLFIIGTVSTCYSAITGGHNAFSIVVAFLTMGWIIISIPLALFQVYHKQRIALIEAQEQLESLNRESFRIPGVQIWKS